MGLDIYLSKRTFIGAMFNSREISGVIDLFSRGRRIPIDLKRVSYITEDIYHGRKTWWLLEWLQHELPDCTIENSTEYRVEAEPIDRLHVACDVVLKRKRMPDFRMLCSEKLFCNLKENVDEDVVENFLYDLERLKKATDRSEMNDGVSFVFTASW